LNPNIKPNKMSKTSNEANGLGIIVGLLVTLAFIIGVLGMLF